jgi:hypothetical protein
VWGFGRFRSGPTPHYQLLRMVRVGRSIKWKGAETRTASKSVFVLALCDLTCTFAITPPIARPRCGIRRTLPRAVVGSRRSQRERAKGRYGQQHLRAHPATRRVRRAAFGALIGRLSFYPRRIVARGHAALVEEQSLPKHAPTYASSGWLPAVGLCIGPRQETKDPHPWRLSDDGARVALFATGCCHPADAGLRNSSRKRRLRVLPSTARRSR